jgi:magnesium transporter
MLSFFVHHSREMRAADPPAVASLPEEVVWIDLKEPSTEEIRAVEHALGIEMPTREEMREIEESSRIYEERDALYLTATIPIHADTGRPDGTEVTFILKGDRLVTLRYADPQPFRSLRQRLERYGGGLGGGHAAFFWLIDATVSRLADLLERSASDIDALSGRIFAAARHSRGAERPDLMEAIGRIGLNGEIASYVRESLLTLTRILFVLSQTNTMPPALRKDTHNRAKALNRDVHSLVAHADFLSHKINFLLDATLGLINIEQNAIIKIFSVVAVVFLPPTLIASIYGMNFEIMPELAWPWGYPFALVLMLMSAVFPYLYFKRQGWL